MRKKFAIAILCFFVFCCFALFACAEKEKDTDLPYNEFTPTSSVSEIGAFSAISPKDNAVTFTVPVFSWSDAENADSYTLEIASTDEFDSENDKLYFKKTGITSLSFSVGASLKTKNRSYYWRVTAVNSKHKKLFSDAAQSFYYQANVQEEVEIDIAYADEWAVHKEGSVATVGIDKKDFFGNGKNSLTLSFDKEDTDNDDPESKGWIVVSHSREMELYGVDAFYFNFYYAGCDSEIYFRVVDEDNEYWHAPVKFANDGKQTVIIRFDEFTLRTKGNTMIQNQVFDYNYIKSFELVFEKTFGDGIVYFSDLRAIDYENYSHLFVTTVDFNEYKDKMSFENYNFDVEILENGSSLRYAFSGSPNEKNEKGIQGYGLVKLNVEKTLASGDAFKVHIDLTNPSNYKNANVLIRVVELDKDLWSFSQKVDTIPDSGDLVIPFLAFKYNSDYSDGDGFRQFYYIKSLQLGLSDVSSGGAITISDLRVVTLSDEISPLYTTSVSEDGLIDDFSSYKKSLDLYYVWRNSTSNKDEEMSVDSQNVLGVKNTAARFGYKTDMGDATYDIRFNSVSGYNAIEIQAMDASDSSVKTKLTLTLYASSGESYSYVVESLSDKWNAYTIPFSAFATDAGFAGSSETLISENIVGLSLSMQYAFYNLFGFPMPKYLSNNYVYFDGIRFVNADKKTVTELSDKIKPTSENPKLALLSDFDDDTADSLVWSATSSSDYALASLSNDTATGKGQSLALSYQTGMDAVSYFLPVKIDGSVDANGLNFLLKGDDYASIAYVNLYVTYEKKNYQVRLELKDLASEWTRYAIGFSSFSDVSGGFFTMSKTYVPYITKITVAVKSLDKSYKKSSVLMDELFLDGTIEPSTKEIKAYGA